MIKSHNHTLGMLNAQYRSVLKKCWQLNLLAACIALGLTSAALADGTQDDAQEEGSQAHFPATVDSGHVLMMRGSFVNSEEHNESYITQNGTGVVKIQKVLNENTSGGTGSDSGQTSSSGTSISNKTVNAISSEVAKSISGGVVRANGNITANTGDGLIQINCDGDSQEVQTATFDKNRLVALELKKIDGDSLSLNGSVLASTTADENVTSRDKNFVIRANNVIFSNNEIVITDARQFVGSDQDLASKKPISVNGGAIYVAGSAKISDGEFSGNQAVINSVVSAGQTARGGAIFNKGYMDLERLTFSNNQVSAENAYGGAIYNDKADVNSNNEMLSKLKVSDSSFSGNIVNAGKIGMGGAIYNNSTTETTISNSSFANNSIMVDNDKKVISDTLQGFGGAVYNSGKIKISATTVDVEIANNTISIKGEMTDENARGGAIYNDNNGTFDLDATRNIVISSNKASFGGALYNAGTFNILASDVGTVAFNGNTGMSGGAIYNASGILYLKSTGEIKNILFNSNSATGETNGQGGAVYVKSGIVNFDLADNSGLSFENNTAAQSGGALSIQQNGTFKLTNSDSGNIYFKANSAGKQGGAIYNDGTITLDSGKGNINFEQNTAEKGGAIYNTGVFKVKLGENGQLTFASNSDSLYNSGTFAVEGNSLNTSTVNLNADVLGNGIFSLKDSKLVMADASIDKNQKLNIVNGFIDMQGSSQLYLKSGDILSDTNISTVESAVINYTASESAPDIRLANTLTHAGILNAQDGVISTISVNNLVGNNGSIYLDVDSSNNTSDVLKVNNSASGTINVKLSNGEVLNNEGVKIKFAETATDSGFNFTFQNDDTVYTLETVKEEKDGVLSWYLYHGGSVRAEVVNYLMLPRAAVEQTRAINLDISANDNSPRIRYEYGYGNKLRRVQDDNSKVSLWVSPVYRQATFKSPVETKGDIAGGDFSLNVNLSESSKTGLFVSYRTGSYDQNGENGQYYNKNAKTSLDLDSTLIGLYYHKYFSQFYLKGMAYAGEQKANVDSGEVTASAKAIQGGAEVEMGYNAKVSERATLTPMAKASYDYINFDEFTDSSGKKTSYDTIHDIEVEAGLKLSYNFNNAKQLPTVGYVKGSVVQLLENGGSATVQNVKFDDMLKNETSGRVEIGLDAMLTKNFAIGGFGNYTAGSDYNGFAVGGNMKYTW